MYVILLGHNKERGKTMRGLPDSAVWGTYKRVTRTGRRANKGYHYYQANADLLNSFVARIVKMFD